MMPGSYLVPSVEHNTTQLNTGLSSPCRTGGRLPILSSPEGNDKCALSTRIIIQAGIRHPGDPTIPAEEAESK